MEYLDLAHFNYRDGLLFCEETDITDIVKKMGTPVYIYSKAKLIEQYQKFDGAFSGVKNRVFYASKSNFNLSVIKTLVDCGAGIDVNSEGELFRALTAGAKPENIIFSGVGKTKNEIEFAISKNIHLIKAESADEVLLINAIAKKLEKVQNVSVRINPDVVAETHPFITTGKEENKFGVNIDTAIEVYSQFKSLPNIRFTGVDMHIGSQLISAQPFIEAIVKLLPVFNEIKRMGIELEHFDVGGGFGIEYGKGTYLDIEELANELLPSLNALDTTIYFEPGRYFTAEAGVLIAEVLYSKKRGNKSVYVIDGAMTELIRPVLYSAFHNIQPVKIDNNRSEVVADIVGPVCESGDFLAKDRRMKSFEPGELLAVMCAGAYGSVMSSNYNARLKAPEVMVDGAKFNVIRKRESLQDLIKNEILDLM